MNETTAIRWPITTKYLVFRPADASARKTAIVDVVSKRWVRLGQIRWYGAWRCYAFYPNTDTLFNRDCIDAISGVLGLLMHVRQAK